jgi:hypothetical protein
MDLTEGYLVFSGTITMVGLGILIGILFYRVIPSRGEKFPTDDDSDTSDES